MDRFEAMSTFLMVADLGSFSAASRALSTPVTTLSRKVSDLEAHLGAKLLIRTTRKLTLTDAGVTYLAAARQVLEMVGNAEKEAAGEFVSARGELVITAPIQFGRIHVLPIVTEFLARFPEINIRLQLSDGNVDLLEKQVDIAVRIGVLPDSSMVATKVGSLRTVICASPLLLEKLGTPQSPEELFRFPSIAIDGPSPFRVWRLYSASGAIIDTPICARLTVTTADAAVHAAISGVGFARLLYYQVADAINAGELKVVLDTFEPPVVPISLMHISRDYMPMKVRQFLDFSADRIRAQISALSQ